MLKFQELRQSDSLECLVHGIEEGGPLEWTKEIKGTTRPWNYLSSEEY